MTDEKRSKYLGYLVSQCWKDVDSKSLQLKTLFLSKLADKVPEGLEPAISEFFEYYAMKRGFHPNAIE